MPGVLEEEGREVPICADLQVALVDMDASVAQQLRLAGEGESLGATFSVFATPDGPTLVAMALSWTRSRMLSDQEAAEVWYSGDAATKAEQPLPKPRRRYRYRTSIRKAEEANRRWIWF